MIIYISILFTFSYISLCRYHKSCYRAFIRWDLPFAAACLDTADASTTHKPKELDLKELEATTDSSDCCESECEDLDSQASKLSESRHCHDDHDVAATLYKRALVLNTSSRVPPNKQCHGHPWGKTFHCRLWNHMWYGECI